MNNNQELLQELDLSTETYIGEHIDHLWSLYQSTRDKKSKSMIKSKYNEFASAENKRLGREYYTLIH